MALPVTEGSTYPDPGGLRATGVEVEGIGGRKYRWTGSCWSVLTLTDYDAAKSLVSGAWTAATSGTWRAAALGALPRFAVSGGASGGTWTLSYRNAAGTVTSDPTETVAAGVTDVSPIYLDDATEIMVTVTGTVTVEMH